jgi:hypothetical protein
LCRRRRSGAQDRILLERHDPELGRRLAEERPDEKQLVEVAGVVGLQRAASGREPGLDLEMCSAARRERALGGNASACDEERARVPVLRRRSDDAPLDRPQPLQSIELSAHSLERLQPVSQPCRVLVPSRVRELDKARAQSR